MIKISLLKFYLLSLILILLSESSFSNNQKILKTKQINKKTTWDLIKGSEPHNAIFLGMWTTHFKSTNREDRRWSNELIGGVYKSFFAGTFLNSFNDRAYVFGIQRDVYNKTLKDNWKINAGYRLGLVHGYDKRMSDIAGKVKLLPFPEVYSNFMYKDFGLEFSWCVSVITAKFIINF